MLCDAVTTLALGFLSDHYAELARISEGVQELSAAHRAIGLHEAMILVPMALQFAAITIFLAAHSFLFDVERFRSPQVGVPVTPSDRMGNELAFELPPRKSAAAEAADFIR